jgi:hypothetical protein
LALALAQACLCEAPVDGDACGSCVSCGLVTAGNHPDVVQSLHDRQPMPTAEEWRRRHYEGYSDWIRREIGEQAFISPLLGRGRVFIVHAADRLHAAAANGLLKALEEPPAGVRFLLTCAQAEAVLPTIRSRCQRYRLQALDAMTVAAILEEAGVPLGEAHRRSLATDGGHRPCWGPTPGIPLHALRQLALEGFRTALVAECLDALPKELPAEAEAAGQTLAAVHRQTVRVWLRVLARDLRSDLVGDPATHDRIHRLHGLERDLSLNIPPRVVLEALGIGTLEPQLRR